MSTLKLRGLAKAYSDGLIDRKQYIRERRQLIDGIVAGELEIVPYDAPQPAPDPAIERTFSDGEATLEIPHVDPDAETKPVAPAKPRRSGSTIVIIVLGLAVAAYALWHTMGRVDPGTPTVTAPAATSTPETPNPAGALLDSFLDENTWLPKRIDGFLLAWEQESRTARDALIDTPTMRRAADLITQQILEEKALFELGEQDTALRKQRRLLDLADALSIENERISRQETEWLARHDALRDAQTPGPVVEQDPPETGVVPTTESDARTHDDIAAVTAPPDPPAAAPEPEPEPVPEPAATTPGAIEAPEPEIANATSPAPAATRTASDPATPAAPAAPVPTGDGSANTESGAAANGRAADANVAANTTPPQTRKSSSARKGCRAALAKQRRPYCRDQLGKNLRGPTLVVLPAGKAEIGGSKPTEKPKYTVEIKRPFGLGVFEVSNAEFSAFCQATKQACPAQPWSDPDFPVVNVSWSLAAKYTRWLSEKSGATYRLPSESEWEYAARAGTSSPYPFGDEVLPTHARFSFRGPESTPVAANDRTVNRNKFRLYHMIGNVREWVLDAWHDNHAGAATDGSARVGDTSSPRVARGGSYSDGSDRVRSASRVRIDADRGDAQTGFRVLREID